jgi:DNA/RNA-binding domain of Phe-tRNA-synthetase-like protein
MRAMIDLTIMLPIRLAVIEIDGVRVNDDGTGFERLDACAQAIRARCRSIGATSPSEVDGVQIARELFRSLGIDPTKRRPSSEALLKRVLSGKPMPRVNTLVDVGNWCSLDFLLPLGLYDAERIVGAVSLRRGEPGDGYEAIGDKIMNLEGRYLLADADGPFGSPITDSRRTAVNENTTRSAVFLYAPIEYDESRLDAQAHTMAERIVDICSGNAIRIELFAGATT